LRLDGCRDDAGGGGGAVRLPPLLSVDSLACLVLPCGPALPWGRRWQACGEGRILNNKSSFHAMDGTPVVNKTKFPDLKAMASLCLCTPPPPPTFNLPTSFWGFVSSKPGNGAALHLRWRVSRDVLGCRTCDRSTTVTRKGRRWGGTTTTAFAWTATPLLRTRVGEC